MSLNVNINWSNGYNSNSGFMSCYVNYMYFPYTNNNQVIMIDLSTGNRINNITGLNSPYSCLAYGGYLYIGFPGGIGKYDLSGNVIKAVWSAKTEPAFNICTDGTYIYSDHDNIIIRFNMDGSVNTYPWAGGYSSETYAQMASDGNYIYVSDHQSVQAIDVHTQSINYGFQSMATHGGVAIYNNYVYVGNGSTISQYNLADGSLVNSSFATNLTGPYGMTAYKNYLYVYEYLSGNIARIQLPFPLNTDSALALYYPFDSDVYDYASGSGVSDATIVGNAQISNTVYKVGNGSFYQGTNNGSAYLQLPTIAANTGGYSFSCWVYLTSSSNGIVFGFQQNGYNNTYLYNNRIFIWVNLSGQLSIGSSKSDIGSNVVVPFSTPTLNTWYHIVWTMTTSSQSIVYLNNSVVLNTTSIPYLSYPFNTNYILGDPYGSGAP